MGFLESLGKAVQNQQRRTEDRISNLQRQQVREYKNKVKPYTTSSNSETRAKAETAMKKAQRAEEQIQREKDERERQRAMQDALKQRHKYTYSSVEEMETDDFDENDIPTMQQMSEMLTDKDRKSVLRVINEYERGQMNEFVEQLNIISDACYIIDSTILPTLDDDIVKYVCSKYTEYFSLVLNTIDEMRKMLERKCD